MDDVAEVDLIAGTLESLARGEVGEWDSYFHWIEKCVEIDDTKTLFHAHCFTLDGSKRPRIHALVQFMVANILDYAIPRQRILEAKRHQERTGSSHKMVYLWLEARQLFTKLAKSGEGGELLLFLLGERVLKLPQLICKMNLKTATQMHFHGADGIHVGVSDNNLCLYWGESKLHSDASQAIRECIDSLSPLLLGNGGLGSPEERDLQLLRQHMNVDSPELVDALRGYLDVDDPRYNKLQFRGLCLIGFDSDAYPTSLNSDELKDIVEKLRLKIPQWKKLLGKRIKEKGIDSFHIHAFYLPFPSVDVFRLALKGVLHPV
ncbi:MAG TPA: DUF1837 domain-containing protein [Nitrosospira sp.]|nr:DUF1837 domain-containing protein [Nitrosospira sp.]